MFLLLNSFLYNSPFHFYVCMHEPSVSVAVVDICHVIHARLSLNTGQGPIQHFEIGVRAQKARGKFSVTTPILLVIMRTGVACAHKTQGDIDARD